MWKRSIVQVSITGIQGQALRCFTSDLYHFVYLNKIKNNISKLSATMICVRPSMYMLALSIYMLVIS